MWSRSQSVKDQTGAVSSAFSRGMLSLALLLIFSLSLSACSLFAKPKPAPVVEHRVLKKKIVMTGFAVKVPLQVQDLDDVAQGIPREMLSRLERSGNFLTRQSKDLLSFDIKQDSPSTKLVKQVAADNDAQFVVAGEVRNAGIRSDKKFLGMWETRSRHIEIEFAIYDGMTGAFLSRHHLYRPAEDEGKVGRDKPFGSVAFYATNFGKAIDAVLEESVAWIRKDLAAFPMMSRIIQVNGNQIMLDAGVNSSLIVGDVGLVVSEYDQLPAMGLTALQARPSYYGAPQASMGKVQLNQTQLQFAMGEVEDNAQAKAVKVKVGDFVRFDAAKP
ncbi:hypothetical protein H8K33_00570 [Undibacterium amnicola]|uniref:Flagellar assembly protein T middle domain-containing protein n=1 Tax=Undibacterium amnicola TaxID=1834038 RepID=A0ABR6XKE9_9BURK|nr:flagella assembly protein FlgT middle domain-containing protein [Undibacterium amnicola]MBC3829994.1 hypothetical protein [Undibacterium amnicola]